MSEWIHINDTQQVVTFFLNILLIVWAISSLLMYTSDCELVQSVISFHLVLFFFIWFTKYEMAAPEKTDYK